VISTQFLLDTNVLSEPLKPQPNQKVLELLATHSRAMAVSATSYQEIVFGYAKLIDSRRKLGIEAYVYQEIEEKLLILPYDRLAAKWHALEQGRLRRIGKTPPSLDGQIAAVAATNNLTLVTRNVKDFQYFQGIKIENWFE